MILNKKNWPNDATMLRWWEKIFQTHRIDMAPGTRHFEEVVYQVEMIDQLGYLELAPTLTKVERLLYSFLLDLFRCTGVKAKKQISTG